MNYRNISTGVLIAAALSVANGAAAQVVVSEDPELRARQEALFEQMLTAPDDLNLMFEHALVSIELRDFEAAISTLERMLIFNPELARAKVELGAAYFRLGAYENARYYFEDVLENHNPPVEVARRVNGFLDEIGKRTQTTGITGIITAGVAYSSNANLGPPDNDVLLGGAPAVLNDNFVESDDVGFRFTASARHYQDLGQPDGDAWITDLNLYSLHFIEETRGDIDSFSIATGPRLSLEPETDGAKVRPFAYGDFVLSDNDLLYVTGGAGVRYVDPITEELAFVAAGLVGWREYVDRGDFSGLTARASAGVVYNPDPSLTVSSFLFAETDRADAGFNANYEIGGRLGATYRYDSGLSISDRLWSVSAYATASYRDYDDPNVIVDPNTTRRDIDFRAGASHVFHLTGGWFVQADVDYLLRDSNIRNFDIDNISAAISAGYSF